MKAVIFDMDGVLVDSEPVYIEAFTRFLEAHGCQVDEAYLRTSAGASGKRTWEIVADMWYEKIDGEELRKLYHRENPDFGIPYKEVIFPGVKELLSFLKEHGMRLALASSSSDEAIRQTLEETGLSGCFDYLVSGRMFRESKPNPEVFLYTLAQLGLPAEECLGVEDSTYGIQAAKAAGLKVAAVVDHRFDFDQSKADYFLEKTADLRELFEEKGWLKK